MSRFESCGNIFVNTETDRILAAIRLRRLMNGSRAKRSSAPVDERISPPAMRTM